jgi:hypothetical protein
VSKKESTKPLSKTQLAVIKSMLFAKLADMRQAYRDESQEAFEIKNKAFDEAMRSYTATVAYAERAEVQRRPSTYLCGGSPGCRVQIDTDKLQEYVTKKFGPPPVRPKHPKDDNARVLFPALADVNGWEAQVEVPTPFKLQVEAISFRLSKAVLNGSCDGMIEAIEALGTAPDRIKK